MLITALAIPNSIEIVHLQKTNQEAHVQAAISKEAYRLHFQLHPPPMAPLLGLQCRQTCQM